MGVMTAPYLWSGQVEANPGASLAVRRRLAVTSFTRTIRGSTDSPGRGGAGCRLPAGVPHPTSA